MSRDQMLTDLSDLRDRIAQARVELEQLERDRDRLMVAADQAATPVKWITESAGVSRSRFYQVKDQMQKAAES